MPPKILLFLALIPSILAPRDAGAAPPRAGSPDWRDQVVYFLMTDRFCDGDPSNDDQGKGEFGPQDGNLYSGGDLEGIRRKLDYIKGLGATAVWITPPVANVWYDPVLKMAGYHGYWAENFKKLDAHLGALADYQRLSADLHRRRMLLIQDVVVNHTAAFFYYAGPYDPAQPEKNFFLKKGMIPPRPSQPPFDLLDARDPAQRQAAIYHWTPEISDYKDENQRLTFQMSGLNDLDTDNPRVREALRDSYGYWIKEAGVDGFRFDTAHFVGHEFWNDFIHSASTAAPGVRSVARRLGKKDFLTFGEVWLNATPFADREEKEAAAYLGTPEKPEMSAVLNFPLAQDLRAVFAKAAPPARLSYRLGGLNRHFQGGRASVNFIDNHDMSRFLSESSEPALAQALTAIFTVPGIPVVYAGTEQGLRETRSAMFAAGFGAGGKDHFDVRHPLYRLIQELAQLRRREPLLRRGRLVPLFGAAAGPGPLAYRLESSPAREVLVLFNTAEEEMLLADLQTGLPEGAHLETLFARRFPARPLQIGKGGKLTLRMPARSALVLKASGKRSAAAAWRGQVAITGFPDRASLSGRLSVTGKAPGAAGVSLIIDGRAARPIPAELRADGRWTASFDPAALPDGEHSLLAAADAGAGLALSDPHPFSVAVPWELVKTAVDPSGDDRGPAGAYLYPLASGFQGKADIEEVSLYRRGPGAKLVIKMAQGVSDGWNPPFGFDHVCFDVYIGLPKADGRGAQDLPRLNARMPGARTWDYAAFLGGWKTALYSAEGATRADFGKQLQPAPSVKGSKADGTIELVFDLDAFPKLASFDGASFFVTSWDYDGVEGALRPLAEKPADYVFGGGKPDGPKIMDSVLLDP